MSSSRTTAFPTVREIVDVQADGVDESLTATVLDVADESWQVTVGRTATGRPIRLDPGTRLRLTWRGEAELLGVPAELTATELGDHPRWQLRILGPPERSQRRDAVRAALRLPVVVTAGGAAQDGTTLDVSEDGLRLQLDEAPADREGRAVRAAGDPMLVTLHLDEELLTDQARLVRRHPRADGRWEASVRFTSLTERQQDTLRRRVFAELRAQAARGAR